MLPSWASLFWHLSTNRAALAKGTGTRTHRRCHTCPLGLGRRLPTPFSRFNPLPSVCFFHQIFGRLCKVRFWFWNRNLGILWTGGISMILPKRMEPVPKTIKLESVDDILSSALQKELQKRNEYGPVFRWLLYICLFLSVCINKANYIKSP